MPRFLHFSLNSSLFSIMYNNVESKNERIELYIYFYLSVYLFIYSFIYIYIFEVGINQLALRLMKSNCSNTGPIERLVSEILLSTYKPTTVNITKLLQVFFELKSWPAGFSKVRKLFPNQRPMEMCRVLTKQNWPCEWNKKHWTLPEITWHFSIFSRDFCIFL